MKIKNRLSHILSLLILNFFVLPAFAQEYDKALADSLGSDDYGNKKYVLVILGAGSNTDLSKTATDSLFRGHMQNIYRMSEAGKLIVAGPLQQNKNNYRGVFILDVPTVEEAALLLKNDPAIEQKALSAEFFNWYGSAALPMYLPFHTRIEKNHY